MGITLVIVAMVATVATVTTAGIIEDTVDDIMDIAATEVAIPVSTLIHRFEWSMGRYLKRTGKSVASSPFCLFGGLEVYVRGLFTPEARY